MSHRVELVVNRADFAEARVLDDAQPAPVQLEPGQLRLRVERFSLSANNLTYALLGDRLGYWSLFPRPAPWGSVPAWGFGAVIESAHEDIAVGERLYGLFPMASDAILTAGRVSASLVIEQSPHRRALSPAYNSYFRTSADPIYDPDTEDRQAVIRPLFITSFLLDRLVARTRCWGGDTLVITSASSKTALGLAWQLRASGCPARVIGLTSPGHCAAIARLALYDEVATYDAPPAARRAALIDFSGNDRTLAGLRAAPGLHLRHVCRVGMTHWRDASADAPDPAGDEQFFFAPDAIVESVAQTGAAAFAADLAASTRGFIAASAPWLSIEHARGADAVRSAWQRIQSGKADPTSAIVASL